MTINEEDDKANSSEEISERDEEDDKSESELLSDDGESVDLSVIDYLENTITDE